MNNQLKYNVELRMLCSQIRELMYRHEYEECENLLCAAMQKHPHAPHPHNLYGLLFELQGNHRLAMSHFRAASALDATYKPAHHNLQHFGTFYPRGNWAYDETDCRDESNCEEYAIERDAKGFGRVRKVFQIRVKNNCKTDCNTDGIAMQ